MQRSCSDLLIRFSVLGIGLMIPVVAPAQLSDSSGAAADLARDISESAVYASEVTAPLGGTDDARLQGLAIALEHFSDVVQSRGTSDETRKAYDRVIAALSQLGRESSSQDAPTSSVQGIMLLDGVQELGRYVSETESKR